MSGWSLWRRVRGILGSTAFLTLSKATRPQVNFIIMWIVQMLLGGVFFSNLYLVQSNQTSRHFIDMSILGEFFSNLYLVKSIQTQGVVFNLSFHGASILCNLKCNWRTKIIRNLFVHWLQFFPKWVKLCLNCKSISQYHMSYESCKLHSNLWWYFQH